MRVSVDSVAKSWGQRSNSCLRWSGLKTSICGINRQENAKIRGQRSTVDGVYTQTKLIVYSLLYLCVFLCYRVHPVYGATVSTLGPKEE